ncbi:MAG: hypothetical protein HKM04_04935 [Legionellales bacterium]|nr:hypothetical protein [Legionellales bacterium]
MHNINYELASQYYPASILDTINFFRNIAMEIDSSAESIQNHLQHPGIHNLCFDRESTCLARTKLLEALSYGDASVLLACPGPSLSGLMLRELGSEEQKAYFFNYIETNKATSRIQMRSAIPFL